ncbi:hypothetical protein [Actinoplanes solisilvae]|uniref:hypothetical protein n=1 Tax=Actinoplanes solisilvae TaxID=2486853 RepID=UPI000FDB4DD9|nr:hypothetical protein [Actinoplanes solisilvae]
MRGGLDDALDKLARRDELRRRATGETPGTPAAVTELVEAVAAVVARHPELGVSVGVEGAGDPLLLHFYLADGQVQVNAESAAALSPDESPRHADFDIETDDGYRQGPADQHYFAESDTAERRYGSFDAQEDPRYPSRDPGETSRDLGARLRDLGMATNGQPAPQPHPFAATPPPPVPVPAEDPHGATRRIDPEQHRPAAAEPDAPARPAPEQRGMPTPLPKPIPLQVERPEETEIAARRLAALLRDDPSLLENPRG